MYTFTFLSPKVLVGYTLVMLLYFLVDVQYYILQVNKFFVREYGLCTLVKSEFHTDVFTEGSNSLYPFLEFACQPEVIHLK
jgi:hypothetical protein